MSEYKERDAMQLDEAGNYYGKHVVAMTSESLHSKSDIAAELGYRDMVIDAITKQRDELAALMESIREYASMIPLHLTDEDNHSNRHIKHFVEQIIALSTIKEQKDAE